MDKKIVQDHNMQSAPTPAYLEKLNVPQREAVEALDGAVLVLAGAGTGKTRVLTTRLAHLINSNHVFPSQILAVTFTNKAALEMRERVAETLGQPVEGWWLGTFHSLAARMLRQHCQLVGLESNYTILDPDDQIRLLKQIMQIENIDTKKWAPKMLISIIDRWKDRALTPNDVSLDEVGDVANGKILHLYRIYQNRLKTLNACDFGDLMLHMITIFKDTHNQVLADYHRRFRYIMVDEYQDTNTAQYQWLRLLAQGTGNICCVGDDDQSIYGWRGAEVGNILKFENDFPGAKVIRLEQNYRSTGHILAAASGVISYNQGRLGKTLWSAQEEGEKVALRGVWDGQAEARWITDEIEQLQRKKTPLSQIAVLVRASFLMREFEEQFIQHDVPYRVVGGPRFYERMEVRDALCYLRVVAQASDDLALERIINKPKRGLGNATIQNLQAHARTHNMSLYVAIQDMTQRGELRAKTNATLMALIDSFERWKSLVETVHHAELAWTVLEESGYIQMWKDDKAPDAPGRVENLKELVNAMQDFESLSEFLEHVSLVMENQDNKSGDQVTIMTLHGAKGLEFDAVFLPGWEDGLFPSQRSMDESGNKGLEEERRLAYVGITRARKKSTITYAANRRMYGSWVSSIPSRFVDELPEHAIEVETDTGIYRPQGNKQYSGGDGGSKGGTYGASYGGSYTPRTKDNFSGKNDSLINKLVAERRAEKGSIPKQSKPSFQKDERIMHDKFGQGSVVHVDGNKIDIEFDSGDMKRVLASFVEKI